MTIIYRILSLIINTAAFLLSISLVFSIPMIISSPVTLLPAFIMVAIILYTWFSYKFRREVLQQQKTVQHSLRDWIRVNGIVSLVFCAVIIIDSLVVRQNPKALEDAIKTLPMQVSIGSIIMLLYWMLAYAVILFIHVIWTFALMKKHQKYFEQPH